MKRLFVGAALVAAALIATSLAPIKAVAAVSVDENSVGALKKEIAKLRAENAALRKRTAQPDAARANTAAPAHGGSQAMARVPAKAPYAQPAMYPPVSGYSEIYSGGSWADDSRQNPILTPGDIRSNGWILGGAGRGNWWATRTISTQIDIQAEGTRYNIPSALLAPGFAGSSSTLSYLAGGHLNWRDSQTGLVGVFGGIGDAGGNTGTFGSNNSGVRHGVIGLEGQYYWNALTLYGQAGYDSTMSMGNLAIFDNLHAWFLRGTGRYFFSPNFMVEGTAQYANGAAEYTSTANPNADFNTWLWRLKAEWKPDAMPFSLFATYDGSRTSYANNVTFRTASERVTENRLMAGLRLYMGQDTLLANDRTGATLNIIDPLGVSTSPAMLFPTGQVIFVSDARLKRDIALVGRLDDGLGLYRYRYLWSDTVYVGVMAQEVALIHPDAVVHGSLDDYLRVDYSRLGLQLMT
ncbi:MAG: tail fiber domain-containing protein, partial [Pseudolabrys sp.]